MQHIINQFYKRLHFTEGCIDASEFVLAMNPSNMKALSDLHEYRKLREHILEEFAIQFPSKSLEDELGAYKVRK